MSDQPTRWPNVQAAVKYGRELTITSNSRGDMMIASVPRDFSWVMGSTLVKGGDTQPTIESALDDLECELVKRKEQL